MKDILHTSEHWHPIEEDILRTAKTLADAKRELARNGFKRTMGAIKGKNKRMKGETK